MKEKSIIPFLKLNPILGILGILTVFWLIISSLSEGSTDFADSLIHYKFARKAFEQPELFLDLWGKPLFTILASPFAQFGYLGAKIFNLIVALLTAWFGYKTAKLINIRYSWLFPVFLLFFPVYAVTLISSLTEIIFGLVLMISVFLFFRKNYIWSAIVISLIPFARTEGFGILAAFAFVFLVNKQFRSLPFLLTGTLFFSLIGWNHHHDFFWVFTKIPYSSGNTVYGSGEIFFYWKDAEWIFGTPLKLLILAGTLTIFYQIVRNVVKDHHLNHSAMNEFLLVWLIFIGYILFQSFIWYKGILAVLGSHRFIACVAPIGALIALRGFDSVVQLLSIKKWLSIMAILLILFFVIKKPFSLYQFPIKPDPKGIVFKEASTWFRNSDFNNRKVFYSDPVLFHFLKLDPYDKTKSEELTPSKIGFEQYVPTGSVIFWDAQFSGNEGQLPDSRILQSTHFSILRSVYPETTFKTLGNRDYVVHLAEKVMPFGSIDFQNSYGEICQHYNYLSDTLIPYIYVDFDGDFAAPQAPLIKVIDEQTKNNAVILNPANPFLLVTEATSVDLPFSNNSLIYIMLNMDAAGFIPSESDFITVLSVYRNNEVILYSESNEDESIASIPGLHDAFFVKNYPSGIKPDDYVKLYFYYTGNKDILVNSMICVYPKK